MEPGPAQLTSEAPASADRPPPHSRASEEQRERLLDALVRAAGERGYANTTAEQVARYAGLPAAALEAHFSTLDHCLVAAYDRFFERLSAEVEETCEAAPSWPEQVRLAVRAALEYFAEAPGIARLFAVEALAVGPAALDRHLAVIDRVAALLRTGREHFPRAAAYPESMERTLVAGVLLLVSGHLLTQEVEMLGTLEEEVVELVLTPYVGQAEAKELAASG